MTGPEKSTYPAQPERMGVMVPPAETEDLKARLAQFKIDREAVLAFVRDYLVEAKYDKDGNPLPGQLHDYYEVRGGEGKQKALTKAGASKVKQLFRWHRGAARHVDGEQKKDYCSATIEVPILDKWGHIVGAGIGSCCTAERRFTSVGSVKKYGGWAERQEKGPPKVTRDPDYRAGLHDVISIATKRADTQATIVAAALEEVFSGTTEDETREEKAEEREPAQYPGRPLEARLPNGKFGQHGGKLVAEVQPLADLVKIRDWMLGGKGGAKNPKAWEPLKDAIDVELDARTQQAPGDPDDDLAL